MSVAFGLGSLLIAPPSVTDPRFRDSVLLITHHDRKGTMALCLNKATDYTVTDIAQQVEPTLYLNQPLFWGGPVHPTTVWMLHEAEWSCRNTMQIDHHWSMTSNTAMFHELAQGNYPQRFKMMFGYVGWAPGQLAREVEGTPPWSHEASWLVAQDPDPDWLYNTPEEDLWAAAAALSGNQAVAQWIP